MRKCDQAGKQVVAVFLGVPISPSKQPKIQATSPHTSMSINYQQVKSNGFFTDKGVDASWDISSGYSGRFIDFKVGYQGYVNSSLTRDTSSSFAGSVKKTVEYITATDLEKASANGIIFCNSNIPQIKTGVLVMDDVLPVVTGLGVASPLTGGVRVDPKQRSIGIQLFNLYEPKKDLNGNYSAMSAGLESKDEKFNPKNGNIFKYKDEKSLKQQLTIASEYNYMILDELKKLAEADVEGGKNKFEYKPVKWLTPDTNNVGQYFKYDFNASHNFEMNFTKFDETSDIIDQGHGGFWSFNTKSSGIGGDVTARSTARTYTNTETKGGFGFNVQKVGNFATSCSAAYWGFNINPKAYKQMLINNHEEMKRPDFISEFCWERDQSFALFVPEVYKPGLSKTHK